MPPAAGIVNTAISASWRRSRHCLPRGRIIVSRLTILTPRCLRSHRAKAPALGSKSTSNDLRCFGSTRTASQRTRYERRSPLRQKPSACCDQGPHRAGMVQQGFLRARLRYLSKASARFFSESKVEVREPAVEILGYAPAPAALSDAGQTLREDRLLRSPLIADEPSDAQANSNGNVLPG